MIVVSDEAQLDRAEQEERDLLEGAVAVKFGLCFFFDRDPRSSYLPKLARRLRRSRYFPKAHNSLSRQLNRLAPDLEEQGVKAAYFTEGRRGMDDFN